MNNLKSGELRVCIDPECYIHYFINRVQIRVGAHYALEVNPLQAGVLESAQSSPKVNELIDAVLDANGVENTEKNRSLVMKILQLFEKEGVISLKESPNPLKLSYFGEKGKAYPAWILLEVTSKCNLRCKFCYKSACTDGKSIEMSRIEMIVEHFAGKCRNLMITGGEAMMHPQIEKIIDLTSRYFDVCILSNGLLMSKLRRETTEKISHIQLSLYGYDNESYERYTGLKNGFDMFRESYKNIERMPGTNYVLTVVLNRNNVEHVEEYVAAAASIGAPIISFGLVVPLGKGVQPDNKALLLNHDEISGVQERIKKLIIEYKGRIQIGEFKMHREAVPLPGDFFHCQGGTTSVTVNQEGKVRGCHFIPEELFAEYDLKEYIRDVENGRLRNYESDIRRFKSYLHQNGCSVSDMACAGFCELKF